MNFNLNYHSELDEYKWQFKDYPYIKITKSKKIINTKTGRKLKVCVSGYSRGVWINKKFITNLNNYVEKIEKTILPS